MTIKVAGNDLGAEKSALSLPTDPAADNATPPVLPLEKTQKNEYDSVVDEVHPENEYDALVEGAQVEQSAALKTMMKAAQDTNPDQYKRAKDLSDRTGIPVDTVARNIDATEKQAPFLANEYDALLKDNPSTAAFLSEKDHAKLAKDDLKSLTAIEQVARIQDEDAWLPSNLGKTFMHGMATMNTNIAQAPAFIYNVAALPQNLVVKAAGRPDLQVSAPDWMINNPVVDYFRRAQKYFDTEEVHQSPVQAIGEGDFKKASRILASQIVDNAPSQIVTLLSAAYGGAEIKAVEIAGKTYKIYAPMLGAAKNNLQAAGLAFMGMLSGSAQNAQDTEKGKDPSQTGMDALTNAIAEAGFENMGTMGILKHWEGAIAKSFGKGTAKQLMQDVGKALAYSFFGEGAEEFATQFAQDFSDYVTGNPRALDGVVGRAMDAFLIGAGSGISMTSPTAVYSGMVKSQRLNQDIKFWDKFIGAGQESKLRQRDPVAFEAHAERVLKENGKPEKLYIAPDVLQSFFQTDEGLDAKAYNDFLTDMGINDQLAEAAATGKEFEMSAARFAARWAGSDLAQKVAADIRFSPDGMTAKEQAALKDNLQKNIDEMQREYAQLVEENKVPPQAVAMREKLMLPKEQGGFGMQAADADANMAVFLGRAAVAAKAWGITPEQWFAKVNPQLNIGGQYIEGSAALMQTDKTEQDMIAMHNLSEENLAHASKMGGLAVPSLSIARQQHPLSGFGEISLIGSRDLIDPKRASNKVFNADIYSPRYPSVKYDVDYKELENVSKKLSKEEKDLNLRLRGELDAYAFERKGMEAVQNSTALRLYYLRNVMGQDVEIPKKTARTEMLSLNPAIEKYIGRYGVPSDLFQNKDFLKEYAKLRDAYREYLIKQDTAGGATTEEAKAFAEESVKLWYDEDDGNPNYNIIRSLQDEVGSKEEAGTVDRHGADRAVEEAIRPQREAFDKWVTDTFQGLIKRERIYNGEDRAGNTRYLAHDLDNVVRVMKRELQSGEGFNYGLGNVRATVAKRYRTITEIINDREKIISKENFEAAKEFTDAEFEDILKEAYDKTEHKDSFTGSFGTADRFVNVLIDGIRRGNIEAELKEFGFGGMDVERIKAFLKVIRDMPSEYFEAKVQRAVSLSEFSAALVPNNVKPETLALLKKHGIESVVQYDRNAKGEDQGRTEALKELKKLRPDLFFQDGPTPRGSVQFSPSGAIISLYSSANLSTFLHESAHIFMNDMKALIDAGVADVQTTKDFQTLVDFVGGDITTRESQEKLARAFEAYLREGKAPSVKLVPAFRRIKQWLVAIYKSIRGLNVQITPEIRDVFDRLIASENEIAEANRFYSSKQALVDLIPVAPEKKAAVKQLKMDAEETALEKQAKTLLRAYLEATGGKQEIRAQATKEIDALPVYKALKTALEAGGLDPAALTPTYGENVVAALKARFPGLFKRVIQTKNRTWDQEVRSRGGIDPRTMGEYEISTFKESKGGKNVLRADGGAWDDMASSFMDEGLLQVPDNRNPSDYLRELVEQKAKLPNFNPVDPDLRITLDELAIQNNYESPDKLFQDLSKAERRSAAITRRAQEIMQQKEQDILKDLQGQELIPGEEAVHNDKTLTYLIAEAKLLGERLDRAQARRPEILEAKVYKAAAEEVIAKKKVSVAGRFDLYSKAEQKYAKQALEATEKGDFELAFEAKRKQILNHSMVMAAVRARDEKLDIEKNFRPKKFKARLASVENAFAEAAMDLARTYGLSDLEPNLKDAIGNLENIDDTFASMIPEWIMAKRTPSGFTGYRDLSMAELRELDSAIKAVLAYGSDAMKSIEEGEAKTLKEWVDQSVAKMDQLKDRTESGLQKFRDESSRWAKTMHVVDAFTSATTLTQMLSDWMDNFDYLKTGNAGPFKRLYNKVVDAEKEFGNLKTEVMQATKSAWSVLGKAAERIHKQFGHKIVIEGVPMNEDMIRTNRAYWSVNRMIALLLNTGNEGNLEVVKRGLGFTDQQIQKVASYFTADELKAIQEIWDATNLLFPKLDQTHFAIYNRNVPKVEGSPVRFTSADGQVVELKGGYYPLIFDHQLSDRAAKFFEDDMMKNQTQSVIRSSKPSDGMTHARVEGHSLPPLLDMSVWFTHIDATARYISHARILRDLNRFTRDKEWSRTFKKKAGDAHYKTLRSWLQHNANPGRRILNSPLDKAAATLKSMSTAAILGFKVGVGLKQRVALINSAQAIGKGDMRSGWNWILKAYRETDFRTKVLGVSNGDTWNAILKKSGYMKMRDGNIDREISDMRRGIDPFEKKITIKGKEFTARDVQDFAFEWIKMNDRAVASITWIAAYNKYLQENVIQGTGPAEAEKAAIQYADSVVQDTQASSLTPELSEMQRQEGWLRLFTSFMTSAVNYGNRVMQNHRAWTSGAITNKEYMNHVIQELLAFPWITLLITEALRGKLPEWWDWFLAPFDAFASFLPVIRDVFSYKYGKQVGESPVFELPNRAVRMVTGIPKLMSGDKEFTSFLWDVGRVIEAYTKIPALNFVKDVKTVFENLNK